MKEYKIYRLIYNGEIIYIGRTTQLLKYRKSTKYKYIPYAKDCEIELIELTTDDTRETHWMALYMGMGCVLLNKQKGNTGLTEKERHIEYHKEYDKKNKEQIRNYQKEYYTKNKELVKQYNKEYQLKNKEAINERKREYRQRKKLEKQNKSPE